MSVVCSFHDNQRTPVEQLKVGNTVSGGEMTYWEGCIGRDLESASHLGKKAERGKHSEGAVVLTAAVCRMRWYGIASNFEGCPG